MGGVMDLPSSDWFGDFDTRVTIHVIDSARPLSLPSLFGSGENGDRIVVWDDGGAEKLESVQKSWEALQVSKYFNRTHTSLSSTYLVSSSQNLILMKTRMEKVQIRHCQAMKKMTSMGKTSPARRGNSVVMVNREATKNGVYLLTAKRKL